MIAGVWGARDLLLEVEGFRVEYIDDSRPGLLLAQMVGGVPFTIAVMDGTTGVPIQDAWASVTDWDDPIEARPTGPRGEMRVFGVMDDNPYVPIIVRAPGYATISASVRTEAGKSWPERLEIELWPAGRLRGRVLAPTGGPVGGATVVLQRTASSAGALAGIESGPALGEVGVECAPDGSFIADDLMLGAVYTAQATARGFASSEPLTGIRTSARGQEVDLLLRAEGRITVTVQDQNGKVMRDGIEVTVGQGGAACTDVQWSLDSGRVTFGSLDPGEAVVRARAPGYVRSRHVESVVEGGCTELAVRLDPGASVHGWVVDVEGRAVSRARIEWKPSDMRSWGLGEWEAALAGPRGAFRISGVRDGELILVRAKRDALTDAGVLLSPDVTRVVAPAADVRLVVAPPGRLALELLTPDGLPFAGEAWIGGAKFDEYEMEQVTVRAGRVRVDGLRRDGPSPLIAPNGYAWFRTPQSSSRTQVVTHTLEAGVTVAGVVQDTHGTGIRGASIQCNDFPLRSAQSDRDGRFSFERFPRERIVLSVSASGYAGAWRLVPPGSHRDVRFAMRRGVAVRGRLVSTSGESVHSALLEFRLPGARAIELTYV
jgi:hypothetical protein